MYNLKPSDCEFDSDFTIYLLILGKSFGLFEPWFSLLRNENINI